MSAKNTRPQKPVKPQAPKARKKLDSLADYVRGLGRREAAKRFGVHPSTVNRWQRDGIPEARYPMVQGKVRRRLTALRNHEIKLLRTEREILQAVGATEVKKPFQPTKGRPSSEHDYALWLYTKTIIPALRERIDQAVEVGNERLRKKLQTQLMSHRQRFQEIRLARLKGGDYPELYEATEETIDEIANLLAEREGKSVQFFYKKWRTP